LHFMTLGSRSVTRSAKQLVGLRGTLRYDTQPTRRDCFIAAHAGALSSNKC